MSKTTGTNDRSSEANHLVDILERLGKIERRFKEFRASSRGEDDQNYERSLDLWRQWQKQRERCRRADWKEGMVTVLDRIEDGLVADMHRSIYALAAVLMIEMENNKGREEIDGLMCASLRAIRPQLVGAIAEAADRVLAEEKEAQI